MIVFVNEKGSVALSNAPFCIFWIQSFGTLFQIIENLPAQIVALAVEFSFDAQKLVVFADAVGAAGGAGFDLAGV